MSSERQFHNISKMMVSIHRSHGLFLLQSVHAVIDVYGRIEAVSVTSSTFVDGADMLGESVADSRDSLQADRLTPGHENTGEVLQHLIVFLVKVITIGFAWTV